MTPGVFSDLERDRLAVQRELDGQLSAGERNRLGRFATPRALAAEMMKLAGRYLPSGVAVNLLDPAVGTGVFFSAAIDVFGQCRGMGFEIDPATASAARRLWSGQGLAVRAADFCRIAPPRRAAANLVVCNPPYVRHHHLPADYKRVLRGSVRRLRLDISGLAGLYAYFMVLADPWLRRDGVGVWIVPSEFLDVNYGRVLRTYLARDVQLLRVHRFQPTDLQFRDALVTSVVVVFRKAIPTPTHSVELSVGGTLSEPERVRRVTPGDLDPDAKWSSIWTAPRSLPAAAVTVGDLFDVRRGMATGANDFFIMTHVQAKRRGLPTRFLRPVLPGPRAIVDDTIANGPDGFPAQIEPRVVLDCPLSMDRVRVRFPALHRYLRHGERLGIHQRYLPRHRQPWYSQESRPPAPILCTYMARRRGQRCIRFLRNHSRATATNVYHLLYPRGSSAVRTDDLFERLRQVEARLDDAGRTYAGGLVKIEPRELAALPMPAWSGPASES